MVHSVRRPGRKTLLRGPTTVECPLGPGKWRGRGYRVARVPDMLVVDGVKKVLFQNRLAVSLLHQNAMPVSDDQNLLVNALTSEEQMQLIEDWDRYDVDQSGAGDATSAICVSTVVSGSRDSSWPERGLPSNLETHAACVSPNSVPPCICAGTVTKQEFLEGEAAWFKRVYGTEISKEDLDEKFLFWERTRDKDKSGEVSWHEYSESKAMLILDQRGDLKNALTKEEVADAREAFNVIDKDGSDAISESEARAFFEKRAKRDVENGLRTAKAADAFVEKQTKMLFFFKDADASGTVDFDEFIAEEAKNIIGDRFQENKSSLSSDIQKDKQAGTVVASDDADAAPSILTDDQIEHAKMKFADWDTDNSGSLSLKELQSITKDLNLKVTAKQFRSAIKKQFKKADTDGDKSLSFEEFLPIYNILYIEEMDFNDV